MSGAEGDACDSMYTERGLVYRCHRKGEHHYHLGTAPGSVREWAHEDADRDQRADGAASCEAALHFFDQTFDCQLPAGHEGKHRDEGVYDGKPWVIEWTDA